MAWKELKQIITEYQRSDGPFALATLVKSSGSTYRQPGSRMLILQGRPSIGRLSAGCIEEEVADVAQAVILNGTPSKCSFDLRSRKKFGQIIRKVTIRPRNIWRKHAT